MDDDIKKKLLKTAGWISIGFGMYLIHLGMSDEVIVDDNVMDMDFTIIED